MQQIEKTRAVSLWINGSILIEIEKMNEDLFRVFICDNGSTVNRCTYWNRRTFDNMKNAGFLQIVD